MQVPAKRMELFIHSTKHTAPYVHPRLDLILELCQTFPSDEAGTVSRARMNIHYFDFIKKTLTPQLSIDPTCTYRQAVYI